MLALRRARVFRLSLARGRESIGHKKDALCAPKLSPGGVQKCAARPAPEAKLEVTGIEPATLWLAIHRRLPRRTPSDLPTCERSER